MEKQHHEEAPKMDDRPTTPEGWDALCWPKFGAGKTPNGISRGLGCMGTHTAVAQSHARWEQRNEQKREAVPVVAPAIEAPPVEPEPRKIDYPKKRAPARSAAEIDAILWPLFEQGLSIYAAAGKTKTSGGAAKYSHLRWQTGTKSQRGVPVAQQPPKASRREWSTKPRLIEEVDAICWPLYDAGESISAARKMAHTHSRTASLSRKRWEAARNARDINVVAPVLEDTPLVPNVIQPCIKNDTSELYAIIGQLTLRESYNYTELQRAAIRAFADATWGGAP